jgi:glycosyltransferase involved in cell wall biosynthesis
MMKSAVDISVIVPCYNGAKFVRETLESALQQTHPPLEVIVVDDGSTDDSAAIAESFGPPVRVIRQANAGESSARNKALQLARGTHCYFLDADDLVCPTTFETMSGAIINPLRDVVLVGHAKFKESAKEPYDEVLPQQTDLLPGILSSNYGPPICWLVPTELARRAGGFCESLRYFEDWDFWCQVALAGGQLKPLQVAGALYRRHAGAQTFLMRANGADRDRTRGRESQLDRAKLVDRAIQKVAQSTELTAQFGPAAFWAGCTAIRAARREGVHWNECRSLLDSLASLMRISAPTLRQSRLGQLSRVLGLRNALALREAFGGLV